jgi:uncharacterized protein with NRDE domain
MCTLIVLDRIAPGVPLVVASNRDEYHSRPAAPPARVDSEDSRPSFVAPQDLEAGGTWMGVNAEGLFCGLTNRPIQGPRGSKRSRGLLVRDALRQVCAADVERDMREDAALGYNPFHLLAADGRSASLTLLSEEGPPETRSLDPGVHVVCNRDPDDPASGKVAWIRDAAEQIPLDQGFEKIFAGLRRVLASHPSSESPLENPCVHTPDYGTRSSTILALGPERWRYWHTEGAPCEAKYSNLTRLLDEIRQVSPTETR